MPRASKMRISPNRLFPPKARCYYLFGDDEGEIFDCGERLLLWESDGAQILRADPSEWERVAVAFSHRGLFSLGRCHALIRDVAKAGPKDGERILQLIDRLPEDARLILCGPGMDRKKALHKRLIEHENVVACDFPMLDAKGFSRWLQAQLQQAQIEMEPEAFLLLCERLNGLRQAAKRVMERLKLYLAGERRVLTVEEVGTLLGEKAPVDLARLCHFVALRQAQALRILEDALVVEGVAAMQIVRWLQIRIRQLLLYRWHASRGEKPFLFGEHRRLIPMEAARWEACDLVHAMKALTDVEAVMKGGGEEEGGQALLRVIRAMVQA